MTKVVPVRFKRMAEAFDVAVREQRPCESSGSEHSPENTMNLSDLVNSFIENEAKIDITRNKIDVCDVEKENESDDEYERAVRSNNSDLKENLQDLFGCNETNDERKRKLYSEIEEAYRFIGNVSFSGFKRRLMTRLREKGFDTGLCKSKWDKDGKIPSGLSSYEYVDINIDGTRHVVEVNLASQFEIARPTNDYSSLLLIFPIIYVGKIEDFKRIVRIMCTAIRHSMRSTEIALPPWRRYGYMYAKWFGSYKRTINESSVKKGSDAHSDDVARKTVGFVPFGTNLYYC